jgi:hypothetical protein
MVIAAVRAHGGAHLGVVGVEEGHEEVGVLHVHPELADALRDLVATNSERLKSRT